MATAQMNMVIRHVRRAVLRQDAAGRTDGQLLASFIDQKDETAFETLVRRHGPMVFGVCRRVVRNHHDAEDACQATFLVLARKAASVRPREMVANWLHGVASRTALKARAMTAKRLGREKQATEMSEPEAAEQDKWRDLQPLIDQELNGLPGNYRLPILLCDLEGKTIKEATQQLGWPQGTLAGRLARGRKLLAKRLANRGVVLSAGSLAAVVSENVASAGVPTSLLSSTVQAAARITAGQAIVAGEVPAKVAALMEGVMKSMMLTKLKTATAVLLVLGMVAFGGGLVARQIAVGQQIKAEDDSEKPANRQVDRRKGIDEKKSLEGTWLFGSFERGGDFQSEDELKKLQPDPFAKMVFTPGECTWELRPGGNQIKVVRFDYVLRASEGVKWIEFTPKSNKDRRSMKCPYSFQGELGNELRISFPHELTKDGRLFAYHYFKRRSEGEEKGTGKSLDEAKLHGEWTGKVENVNFSLIFGPGNSIRRITENREPTDDVGTYSVDWGKTPFHLDVKWGKSPTGQTIMEFTKDAKLRIEIGGDIEQARPKTFTDETWVLTKKEKQPAGSKQAEQAADKDLEIADFYRRTGKFGSAQFYYELIRYRYPDTDHAKRAQQGLEELKKHRIRLPDGSEGWETPDEDQQPQPAPTLKPQPPAKVGHVPADTREIEELRQQVRNMEWRLAALEGKGKREADAKEEPPLARVGRIIVVGNEKTPTSVILKKVPLYPGQILQYPDLRIFEKNLAALNATITVIEGSEGSEFKDILVTVKEK